VRAGPGRLSPGTRRFATLVASRTMPIGYLTTAVIVALASGSAIRPRGSRCLAALLVSLSLSASFAGEAVALPARFWGVVPQALPTPEQLDRLHRGGARSIRVPIAWAAVRPHRNGPSEWSGVDALVRTLIRGGFEFLPVLSGAPSWAVREVAVPGTGGAARAPRNLPAHGMAAAGWKRFVREAVARYGSGGSFWAENPDLPRRPVRFWQIWNEPNFKYFVARPSPAEYGRLVDLSYAAIRSADRQGRIVLAGLFARPAEAARPFRPPRAYFATDFLARMYRSTPGVRQRFAAIALHPYGGRFQYLAPQIEEVRDVLERNHDGRKALWITELGWSSRPPTPGNSFARGRRGQARQLAGAFSVLRRNQRRWRIQRVYWFSVDDLSGSCNFCDGSGLFAAGFRPKPAWHAFVRFAGGTVR